MTAFASAFGRAAKGGTECWPCLLWLADFVLAETGRDPAAEWRGIEWDEWTADRELARLSLTGFGNTLVERALDAIASREGWIDAEGPQQGATMVGCYRANDPKLGVPAIFDGDQRWLVSYHRNAMLKRETPARVWEIPRLSAA
ncbi:MAG: hypothetical protein ABI697_12755 [Devosia sp.]